MHNFMNRKVQVMHRLRSGMHNLEKFFAFHGRKYTLPVYKDLSAKILLSKKENINGKHRISPSCYLLPAFLAEPRVLFQVWEPDAGRLDDG